ncbi:MAG TPA: POTRA domain-containing protein, partial [Gammaproteobacteria bacterium]|nr:POTRA domain-containing protein [Gammaproteobacteria bacterium]
MLALVLASVPALAAGDTVRVEVEGVRQELGQNIRAYLSLVELSKAKNPTPDQISRDYRSAREEIRTALQPFGYYNPSIHASLKHEGKTWTAHFRVKPGPATTVTQLELRVKGPGAKEKALQKVIKESGLKKGKRLNQSDYSATKDTLLEQAVEAGYLDASFARHEIRVNPEKNQASVFLVLDSGPAYYFGDIRVKQDILDPQFVQRLVPVHRKERLSSARLLNLQFALSDSDYFDRVSVNLMRKEARAFHPKGEKAPKEARLIPVEVDTDPKKPRRYSVGVGYGTDTGPRLTGSVEFRHLNRQGHQFRSDLFLSPVRQGLAARYKIPIKNVRTDSISVLGRITQEELGDTRNNRYAVGASQDRGFLGWQRSIYAYVSRDFTFVNGSQRAYTLLTPGASISRTKADDPLYPRRGWSLFFDAHGAHSGFLSDATFLQGQARAQAVLPLFPKARLLGRVHAGATEVRHITDIPASERFFAGGDRSVRGYAYQS